MKYKELVAISGLGGLFQLLSTKSDGAIVKNVDENVSKFVPARLHNVTPLDSIEVYSETDNVRLFEVFKKFEQNEKAVDISEVTTADNKKVKTMFTALFPDHDKERVYVSDMKKIMKWYLTLKKYDLLKEEEVAETIEEK
jgi:Flp pilus assembly secretin CpaC